MIGRHLCLALGIGFLGPLAENRASELSNLLHHPIFGVMRITSIAHGLFECVNDLMQALEQLRSLRQALFESATVLGLR